VRKKTTALRPSLVLKQFGESQPSCGNFDEIPEMTWDSSGNGTFVPRKEFVAGRMSGNEQLGNNS